MSTHSSHQANSQITQPDVRAAMLVYCSHKLMTSPSQISNGRGQTSPTEFYIGPGSPVANMGPPPFSYEPSLDVWHNPSVLSPDLDNLLLPSNEILRQPHERSSLPGISGISIPPSNRGENNSMMRWSNDIGPWTPLRNTGNTGQSLMVQPYPKFTTQRTPPYSYRDPVRSEVSASTNGQHLHDSAYGSRSLVSNSDGSLDHGDTSRSCQSDTVDLNGLQMNGNATAYGAGRNLSQDGSLDGGSDTSYRPRTSASLTCPHEKCSHVSRNNSEHK